MGADIVKGGKSRNQLPKDDVRLSGGGIGALGKCMGDAGRHCPNSLPSLLSNVWRMGTLRLPPTTPDLGHV